MRLSREVTISGKTTQIPVTLVDEIVNWFDPVRGQARFQSRARMAISGGYTGADRTRRANQSGRVSERDADTAILPDLPTLREESQHLFRNNAIAGGAIRTNVTKVVGTGLKVKPQIDQSVLKVTPEEADAWQQMAVREFLLATETREIDAERMLPFSLWQGLAFLKVLEDGDVLVNMPRIKRPGSPYTLKLQMIEAARLVNKDNAVNTASLSGGVKKDADGAPEQYHVLNQHPGSLFRRNTAGSLTWTELDAFGKTGAPLCLHLFDKTRPGQSRGVPYLAPVVELIKQLGRYTDAEVMAAVVSGMLTVFVTNETGDPSLGPAATPDNPTGDQAQQVDVTGMELGYGSVLGLLPGEKIETVNPGRPNPAFDPFMTAILRQIGMSLELPFEVLIKHFTSSYSASRAALMEAWDYFRRRRHWLVTVLCQPVYEAVITEAVARGRLSAPGFFADPLTRRAWLGTNWIGDAPYHLDPLKEINAAEKRMSTFLTTHEEETAAMPQGGADWQSKVPQFTKEQAILRVLAPEPVASPAIEAPEPPDNDLETT
ncbi:MAG TPA: phage portal protein [Candidatus Omnitrophica bacterium]|nr:phage portal protein [Candidatus Omnitrophota bacterium]